MKETEVSIAGREITIEELINQLKAFDPKSSVIFGPDAETLTFGRAKRRGDRLVQIEFNQSIIGNQIVR